MKAKRWSAREERRLRSLYPRNSGKECARLLGRSAKEIASRAKLLKVRRIRRYKRWTAAEDQRLRAEYPHTLTKKLAETFSTSIQSVHARAAKLGVKKTEEYLRACIERCGRQISSHPRAIAARIPKGNVPPNKGLRRPGYSVGRGRMQSTQFKKGQRSRNYLPVGTVRPDFDGYLRVKIADGLGGTGNQGVWAFIHKQVWENAHGPIPGGHKLAFKDGNRKNVAIENLELITDAEMMRRNSIHARRSPELKEAIYALVALKSTITKREKKHAQKQIERPAGSPVRDARAADG